MEEINLSDIPLEVSDPDIIYENMKFIIPPCEPGRVVVDPPEIKIETYRTNKRK